MSLPRHLAFPPEALRKNHPSGDLFSSSTLLDPPSSSTLRARLQSPQPVAQAHPSSATTRRPDSEVFQQFRACFAHVKPSVVQQSAKAKNHSDGDDGTLAQLREAFAEAGLQCYTSVATEIMDAHADLEARIDALAKKSVDVTTKTRGLYSTFGPLSATLCHGKDFSSTTIAVCISSIVSSVSQAQTQLKDLQTEWSSCLTEEKQILAELGGAEAKPDETELDMALIRQIKLFREELDEIVHTSEELLDEIDVEFRELIRRETMGMVQKVMAA